MFRRSAAFKEYLETSSLEAAAVCEVHTVVEDEVSDSDMGLEMELDRQLAVDSDA